MLIIWLLVILTPLLPWMIIILSAGRKLPPGPNTFQLIRKLRSLPNKPHIALDELAKIYGPLMSFRLGGQVVIVASSPSTAMEIFRANNRAVSGRFVPSAYARIPGITHACLALASETNDSWRLMRSLGHSTIYSARSASGLRRAKATEMVRFLTSTHKAGQVVNLEDVIAAAFTNIISNVLTSKDLFHAGEEGERDEKTRRFLHGLVEKLIGLGGFADLFPVLRGFDFWNKGKAMGVYREIQSIWSDIIQERRASSTTIRRHDYFDLLKEHGFSDGDISILLTEQLVAATDSSVVTAVWLVAELIKNRDILSRVCDEIEGRAVGDDGAIDESLLSSDCRYFRACISETLRLHIPVPFLVPRRATETFRTANFTIPKESLVVANAWAIQTSADNWDDATRFDPTRFLTENIADFRFLPFGAGQRMCPGSNVALQSIQPVTDTENFVRGAHF